MDPDTRREAVNALAVRAKTDCTAMPELWDMVSSLIRKICLRYCGIEAQARRYEYEDLCQNAYFGFLNAIKAYEPDRGSFSTLLDYYVRKSCTLEIRKCRATAAPLNAAESLDKPINGLEGITLADVLPDVHALDFVEEFSLHSIAQVILDEAKGLPNPMQTRIINECTYRGRTLEAFGDETGVTRQSVSAMQETAVEWLRRRPVIRSIREEFFRESAAAQRESVMDPYRVKSVTAFRSDFTTIVEDVVMRLEGQR